MPKSLVISNIDDTMRRKCGRERSGKTKKARTAEALQQITKGSRN